MTKVKGIILAGGEGTLKPMTDIISKQLHYQFIISL